MKFPEMLTTSHLSPCHQPVKIMPDKNQSFKIMFSMEECLQYISITHSFIQIYLLRTYHVRHCAGTWDVVMSKPDMVPTTLELTVKSWR